MIWIIYYKFYTKIINDEMSIILEEDDALIDSTIWMSFSQETVILLLCTQVIFSFRLSLSLGLSCIIFLLSCRLLKKRSRPDFAKLRYEHNFI